MAQLVTEASPAGREGCRQRRPSRPNVLCDHPVGRDGVRPQAISRRDPDADRDLDHHLPAWSGSCRATSSTSSSARDQAATEEQKQQTREQLGLTGSYSEQYWRWASSFVQGDFGFSYRNTQPVSEILTTALPITLELVILGLLIACVIGIPLGVLSAVKRDSKHDYAARVGGLIGVSIPSFWLATLLLLFTSRVFGWVPPLNYTPIYEDPIENLSQFILPAISISVFTLAVVMRMVRATMLEVLGQDYVRTARAKGVKRKVVDHAARAPERAHPRRHGGRASRSGS